MNLLNRIIIILAILVVMIVVPLALILPEQAHLALQYAADVVQANLDWLTSLTPGAQIGVRIVLGAIGLIVFVIGLLFLALEVIRVRKNTVKLKDGSGELVMNGVAGHLVYYVDLLPDVLRVRPYVQSTGSGVRATLHVETAPGVHVPTKSGEVRETARRVLEEQLGLRIKGDIKVVVKPVPPPRDRRGRQAQALREAALPVEATPPSPPVETASAPKEEKPAAQEVPPAEVAEENETIDVKAPPQESD
jgi:hypothetical protein